MIRRSPTKLDLRLDDLVEYETMRKALEAKRESERQPAFNPPSWGGKVPQSEILERIGYMPQQNQPSHSRPNI
ncbi:anaphase-promoting complex subunit CDC26 [Halictus rubicundus]|uniref:anaphase-promoting complex subunit CDC26 n=1 Tax=Halictus rubicundus TaxID=77578 RepID=UPI004035E7CC